LKPVKKLHLKKLLITKVPVVIWMAKEILHVHQKASSERLSRTSGNIPETN
jgi:hypothetical protein